MPRALLKFVLPNFNDVKKNVAGFFCARRVFCKRTFASEIFVFAIKFCAMKKDFAAVHFFSKRRARDIDLKKTLG